MKAYLCDPQLKQDFIQEIKHHQDCDNLIKGSYISNGKFCAVGCSIESLGKIKNITLDHEDHSKYELLGITPKLAHIEDDIFEGLPLDLAKVWPLRFAEAINVGADVENVIPKLVFWALKKIEPLIYGEKKYPLNWVIDLYERLLAGLTTETLLGSMPFDRYDFLVATYAHESFLYRTNSHYDYYASNALSHASRSVPSIEGQTFWIEAADKLIELLKEQK